MKPMHAHVEVSSTNQNYRTIIQAGTHEIVSDEPAEEGGKDEGPTSHQLLIASLGTCTAITLTMYLQRKQWEVGTLKINLSLLKSETGTTIHRKIVTGNPITDEQREKLLKIANACPVHTTLTSPIAIQTSIQ